MKIGANEPCPCGSGKKYKRCCARKKAQMSLRNRALLILLGSLLVGGLILMARTSADREGQGGRVWSPEHGHYHMVP